MKTISSLAELFSFLNYTPDNKFHYALSKCEICEGSSFTVVRSHQDGGNNTLLPASVTSCNDCGFLMQNPRFSDSFYDHYYRWLYPSQRAKSDRNNEVAYVDESGESTDAGFHNQYRRAQSLHRYITDVLRHTFRSGANMLDVGCGSGGFLSYFRESGFNCLGNDPDQSAVSYAKGKGIDIDCIPAEQQQYPSSFFDFVFILGSLEHCKDPNEVLKRCAISMRKGSLILLEGRTYPLSHSTKYLNFNHHRFFRQSHMKAILVKHGFEPILSTDDQICGGDSGRSGMGYTFGLKRHDHANHSDAFARKSYLSNIRRLGYVESPATLIEMLNIHDSNLI